MEQIRNDTLVARSPSMTGHRSGVSPMHLLLAGILAQAAVHVACPLVSLLAWPFTLVGLVVAAGGVGLMVAGERAFEAAGTTVSPRGRPTTLVTTGPYRLTRNPMYAGIVLVLAGVAVLFGTLLPLLVPMLVGWTLSRRFIRHEEAALRDAFGEEYERYAHTVSRWVRTSVRAAPAAGSRSGPAVADRTSAVQRLRRAGWWVLLVVCLLYGGFALVLGVQEILVVAGLAQAEKVRAVPLAFVVHALAGGIALIAGPLQFHAGLRRRAVRLHRTLGGIYVAAVWIASLAGLRAALSFDVGLVARCLFGVLAVLWFATTTLALMRILAGQVAAHRAWAIRSFALSLFFLTFSVWVPLLGASGLSEPVAYPLGVFLAWSLNLAVAEVLIRGSRRRSTLVGPTLRGKRAAP